MPGASWLGGGEVQRLGGHGTGSPSGYRRTPVILPATSEIKVMMMAARMAVQKKESMVKRTGV